MGLKEGKQALMEKHWGLPLKREILDGVNSSLPLDTGQF